MDYQDFYTIVQKFHWVSEQQILLIRWKCVRFQMHARNKSISIDVFKNKRRGRGQTAFALQKQKLVFITTTGSDCIIRTYIFITNSIQKTPHVYNCPTIIT